MAGSCKKNKINKITAARSSRLRMTVSLHEFHLALKKGGMIKYERRAPASFSQQT